MVERQINICECGCGEQVPIAKQNRPERGVVKGQPSRFISGHNLSSLVKSFRERFWENIEIIPESGCWIWMGYCDPYGHIHINGLPTRTHRASWIFHNGAIPDGMWVLHRCDTPSCCNPNHLFLGTCADNNKDMLSKGRHGTGGAHRNCKLTEQQVHLIRTDTRLLRLIAIDYGISLSHTKAIRRGTYWK